jgi:hypothetical protein
MNPEIFTSMVDLGGGWAFFLMALWIFRDYIVFRRPTSSRSRRRKSKPTP